MDLSSFIEVMGDVFIWRHLYHYYRFIQDNY